MKKTTLLLTVLFFIFGCSLFEEVDNYTETDYGYGYVTIWNTTFSPVYVDFEYEDEFLLNNFELPGERTDVVPGVQYPVQNMRSVFIDDYYHERDANKRFTLTIRFYNKVIEPEGETYIREISASRCWLDNEYPLNEIDIIDIIDNPEDYL